MSTINQPDLFLPTCCNVCLLKSFTVKQKNLGKCQGCKLIFYCSTPHQKMDWRVHRKFCQAASAILDRHNCEHLFDINGPIKSQDDLNVTTLKLKYILQSILNRRLNYHEEELTSFPVMCAFCYTTNMPKMCQCKKCKAVSFCCEAHEQAYAPSHRTECLQLKIFYCKFKTKSEMFPKVALRKGDPFQSNLTKSIKSLYGIEFKSDPCEKITEYQKFSFVSDFSCIGTVTYIAKHLDMEHYPGEQFTIYVAGATTDEIWFAPIHVEFFFACVPQLKKLNVVFVGPEVSVLSKQTTEFKLSGGRLLCRSWYKAKLEDHFFERPDHLKPNMIVCFNCEISACTLKKASDDPWYKALKYLTEMPGIPLVITSFTSLEADYDYAAFMKVVEEQRDLNNVRLERIIPKQLNPFKELRPHRNWDFNDPERIYYRNGYIQALTVRRNDCKGDEPSYFQV